MASDVWVLYPEEKTRQDKYIRGSEIIEVRVYTFRGTSYGKEIERHSTVKITQARTSDTEAGTAPKTLDLWEFAVRRQADEAATQLLAVLSMDPHAVVYLDDDGKVQVQPLAID